jgi:N4-gp56 family major capsid protein
MQPFVKNPGVSREGDQLGQRGWIGWKTYFTATILNQLWMARAEVAIPELT